MPRKRSSPGKQSTSEPLNKKRKTQHENENITKEALLKALENVEDEIRELKHEDLGQRLKELRGQVKAVLKSHEDKIKRLYAEIHDLKEEIEILKEKNDELSDKNERLMNKLAVAEASWMWEAHLVRFVIDNSKDIYDYKRFDQMTRHLKGVRKEDDLWEKIKNNIGQWTGKHWDMVYDVRTERTGIAHPDFLDLDLIQLKLDKLNPEYREPMKTMLDILKTTAALMKFGRLAKFYKRNKDLFPHLRLDDTRKNVLEDMISWDRTFEDIDGLLQNVNHEEAKTYLEKYVKDPHTIRHYFFIVDFIKDGNSKRLGKLAWELEKCYYFTRRITAEESEALNKLKSLVRKRAPNIILLQPTIAKLHIPDFLPKRLWKHGMKIVEKYFKGH